MKIDTQALLHAFKIVDQVDTQPGLQSSMFARIVNIAKDKIQISLTGLCVSQVICPVVETDATPWTWYIDRRLLGAFLSSASTKQIAVTVTKTSIEWKSGRQKISASVMDPVAGYMTWDSSKAITKLKLSTELRKELTVAAAYAPTTAAADHLSAVCLHKGYGIIASDSFAIAVYLNKKQTYSHRLPVVLSSLLSGATEVLIDKGGAGVCYAAGYLYQPLSSNCLTNYPLKDMLDVVSAKSATKPVLSTPAKSFADAIGQIKSFIFGASTDLKVLCHPSKIKGMVHLSLDVASGNAQTTMPAQFTTDFNFSWAIARIIPWVEHIAALDPNAFITCGQDGGCFVFSAANHRLILAEAA